MFKILHPKYAVQITEPVIPQHLIDDLVVKIGYPDSVQEHSGLYHPRYTWPCVVQMHKIMSEFVKPLDLIVSEIQYHSWNRDHDLGFPHVDVLPDVSNPGSYIPLYFRLNFCIFGKDSTMEWYEDYDEQQMYYETTTETSHGILTNSNLTPAYVMPACNCIVNTIAPHNIKLYNENKLTISTRFRNTYPFEELVDRINKLNA
jgi:hypothetical protein